MYPPVFCLLSVGAASTKMRRELAAMQPSKTYTLCFGRELRTPGFGEHHVFIDSLVVNGQGFFLSRKLNKVMEDCTALLRI